MGPYRYLSITPCGVKMWILWAYGDLYENTLFRKRQTSCSGNGTRNDNWHIIDSCREISAIRKVVSLQNNISVSQKITFPQKAPDTLPMNQSSDRILANSRYRWYSSIKSTKIRPTTLKFRYYRHEKSEFWILQSVNLKTANIRLHD